MFIAMVSQEFRSLLKTSRNTSPRAHIFDVVQVHMQHTLAQLSAQLFFPYVNFFIQQAFFTYRFRHIHDSDRENIFLFSLKNYQI